MDTTRLCLRCMRETAGFEVCMHCGFVNNGAATHPSLVPGMTLENGRYLVGAAMMITQREIWYAGYNLEAQRRVHIRELFPRELVSRGEDSPAVIPKNEDCAHKLRRGCERYLAEFNSVKPLACRNIISLYDFFKENGTAYIVTEFLDGLKLSDFLAQNPSKPAASAAQNVSLQLCAGLEALRGAGFVHAGLSTDSIWMCENGSVKIAAFDSMKLNAGAPAPFLPELSPATAPLEAYEGTVLTPASDIYSVASLIYRMFAGRFPQTAPERKKGSEFHPLSTLGSGASPAVASAVDKALSLKPTERYANINAFVDAFMGVTAKETTLDLSIGQSPEKRGASRVLGFITSALLMLAGAALIAAYFFTLK